MTRPTTLLLLAVLLLGLSHLLLLPPFEGFDETAHYSRLREVAATQGPPPPLADARLARQVEDYERMGPTSYAPVPPFDDNGGLTYRRYAASGNARGLAVPLSVREEFTPGGANGWQAQHPSLPYRLLGAVSDAFRLGLKADLVLMRGICYALAWFGLVIAVYANARQGAAAAIVTAAWPLLLPMWFPEMARLGNDAFLIPAVSLVWLVLLPALQGSFSLWRGAILGLLLALGCLVKLFALPLILGILLALFATGGRARLSQTGCLVLSAVSALALAQAVDLVNLVALFDLNDLSSDVSHHPPPTLMNLAVALAHGLGSIVKSFFWAGTWSLTRPATLAYAPFLLGTALVTLGLIHGRVWRDPIGLAAILLLLPILVGLLGHAGFMYYAHGRSGTTPGWYLHIFVAPLALLLGRGLAGLPDAPLWRSAVAAAGIGCLLFGQAMAYLQTMLFAGCVEVPADSNRYRLPAGGCLDVVTALPNRLAVLSYPLPSAICFGLGVCLTIAGMILLLRRREAA